VRTLGCPKNEVDSERFRGVLRRARYDRAERLEEADLFLLNTCAFIRPAVEESLEALGDAVTWRNESPERKLILAGCLPARFPPDPGGPPEGIDLVVGAGDTSSLEAYLGLPSSGWEELVPERPVSSRYLRISDGCDNACAYCTIPMIRGPYRGLGSDAIRKSAAQLVEQGALEIGLVAQDTGRWAFRETDLTGLVASLFEEFEDVWWRIYYLHPAHFPPGLLELFDARDNVVPYLDLPVQHASDRILRRMGRPYTRSYLESLLGRVESCGATVSVRLTVMVGYPGESDRDFQTLLDFLGSFDCIRNLVVFSYYPEAGTREHSLGREMPDPRVVCERMAYVEALLEGLSSEWSRRLSGRELEVIVDGPHEGHCMYDAPFVDGRCIFEEAVDFPGRFRAEVMDFRGNDILVRPVKSG
jgi:ribosomal protein S12 methylthiotransferase